jgi:hypothetical protein
VKIRLNRYFPWRTLTAFGVAVYHSNFGLLHPAVQLHPVTDVGSCIVHYLRGFIYIAPSAHVITSRALRRVVVSCNDALETERVLNLHINMLKVQLLLIPGGCLLHQQLGEVYVVITSFHLLCLLDLSQHLIGPRWRSGWGTALQTGTSRDRFPMVSLEFFIDIILPAALWTWVRLSL